MTNVEEREAWLKRKESSTGQGVGRSETESKYDEYRRERILAEEEEEVSPDTI